jgi:hypothetical protein
MGVDWTLQVVHPATGDTFQRVDGLPVVAFDGPIPLCLDSADGSIVAVEGEQRRFVNSNIKALGAFLRLYQDYRLRVRRLDEDAASVLVEEVADAMRAHDAQAMSNPESYWRVVVEQMGHGLL